jgi:hypothetical protein
MRWLQTLEDFVGVRDDGKPRGLVEAEQKARARNDYQQNQHNWPREWLHISSPGEMGSRFLCSRNGSGFPIAAALSAAHARQLIDSLPQPKTAAHRANENAAVLSAGKRKVTGTCVRSPT